MVFKRFADVGAGGYRGEKMGFIYSDSELVPLLYAYAGDILGSEGMQCEKKYKQHGDVSCYGHSIAVACESARLALRLRLRVDMRGMIRGALLHDYFLYDWHDPDKCLRLHGFTHSKRALENAERDFSLTDTERDVISKHMFPLTPRPPRRLESLVVTIADKICASREVLTLIFPKIKFGGRRNGLC